MCTYKETVLRFDNITQITRQIGIHKKNLLDFQQMLKCVCMTMPVENQKFDP